jgi:hypothetical protein
MALLHQATEFVGTQRFDSRQLLREHSESGFGGVVATCESAAHPRPQLCRFRLRRDDPEGYSRLSSERPEGIAPGALKEGRVDDDRPAGSKQLLGQQVQASVGEFAAVPGIDAAIQGEPLLAVAATPNSRFRSMSERRRTVVAELSPSRIRFDARLLPQPETP